MRGWPDVDVSGKSSECRPWSSLNCIPSAIAMHADQLIVWSGGARPSTVSGTRVHDAREVRVDETLA